MLKPYVFILAQNGQLEIAIAAVKVKFPRNSFEVHINFFDFLSPTSRAGFPYGAAEIFSLMQHMGCEPDRASFNIMVDAYGRAGLHEGKYLILRN